MVLTPEEIKEVQEVLSRDERLPALFNALSDPTRFRMLKLLLEYRNLCVTDMARVLEISVPAASQQLKILEWSGVIVPERQGQRMCYHVRRQDPDVKALVRLMTAPAHKR